MGNIRVKNIPKINIKNGCNPFTIQIKVTGASKEAKLNDAFANIFIISLAPLMVNTETLLVFKILKNSSLYDLTNTSNRVANTAKPIYSDIHKSKIPLLYPFNIKTIDFEKEQTSLKDQYKKFEDATNLIINSFKA